MRWAVVAGAALLLVVLAAVYVRGVTRRSAPVARTGPRPTLQVRMGQTGSAKLDAKAPLRCFVSGRFVGQTTLAECARRNGVDPGGMDVGLDRSGQVAAAGEGEAELAALPEDADAPEAAVLGATTPPAAAAAPRASCLRFAGDQWREAGVGLSLRACVRTLFEGRCVRPGDALYGRYGERTLRLVPGRVEGSTDDRSFSFVMGQDAEACELDG